MAAVPLRASKNAPAIPVQQRVHFLWEAAKALARVSPPVATHLSVRLQSIAEYHGLQPSPEILHQTCDKCEAPLLPGTFKVVHLSPPKADTATDKSLRLVSDPELSEAKTPVKKKTKKRYVRRQAFYRCAGCSHLNKGEGKQRGSLKSRHKKPALGLSGFSAGEPSSFLFSPPSGQPGSTHLGRNRAKQAGAVGTLGQPAAFTFDRSSGGFGHLEVQTEAERRREQNRARKKARKGSVLKGLAEAEATAVAARDYYVGGGFGVPIAVRNPGGGASSGTPFGSFVLGLSGREGVNLGESSSPATPPVIAQGPARVASAGLSAEKGRGMRHTGGLQLTEQALAELAAVERAAELTAAEQAPAAGVGKAAVQPALPSEAGTAEAREGGKGGMGGAGGTGGEGGRGEGGAVAALIVELAKALENGVGLKPPSLPTLAAPVGEGLTSAKAAASSAENTPQRPAVSPRRSSRKGVDPPGSLQSEEALEAPSLRGPGTDTSIPAKAPEEEEVKDQPSFLKGRPSQASKLGVALAVCASKKAATLGRQEKAPAPSPGVLSPAPVDAASVLTAGATPVPTASNATPSPAPSVVFTAAVTGTPLQQAVPSDSASTPAAAAPPSAARTAGLRSPVQHNATLSAWAESARELAVNELDRQEESPEEVWDRVKGGHGAPRGNASADGGTSRAGAIEGELDAARGGGGAANGEAGSVGNKGQDLPSAGGREELSPDLGGGYVSRQAPSSPHEAANEHAATPVGRQGTTEARDSAAIITTGEQLAAATAATAAEGGGASSQTGLVQQQAGTALPGGVLLGPAGGGAGEVQTPRPAKTPRGTSSRRKPRAEATPRPGTPTGGVRTRAQARLEGNLDLPGGSSPGRGGGGGGGGGGGAGAGGVTPLGGGGSLEALPGAEVLPTEEKAAIAEHATAAESSQQAVQQAVGEEGGLEQKEEKVQEELMLQDQKQQQQVQEAKGAEEELRVVVLGKPDADAVTPVVQSSLQPADSPGVGKGKQAGTAAEVEVETGTGTETGPETGAQTGIGTETGTETETPVVAELRAALAELAEERGRTARVHGEMRAAQRALKRKLARTKSKLDRAFTCALPPSRPPALPRQSQGPPPALSLAVTLICKHCSGAVAHSCQVPTNGNFTGVGKTSLVHLIVGGRPLLKPARTVGCSISVKVRTQAVMAYLAQFHTRVPMLRAGGASPLTGACQVAVPSDAKGHAGEKAVKEQEQQQHQEEEEEEERAGGNKRGLQQQQGLQKASGSASKAGDASGSSGGHRQGAKSKEEGAAPHRGAQGAARKGSLGGGAMVVEGGAMAGKAGKEERKQKRAGGAAAGGDAAVGGPADQDAGAVPPGAAGGEGAAAQAAQQGGKGGSAAAGEGRRRAEQAPGEKSKKRKRDEIALTPGSLRAQDAPLSGIASLKDKAEEQKNKKKQKMVDGVLGLDPPQGAPLLQKMGHVAGPNVRHAAGTKKEDEKSTSQGEGTASKGVKSLDDISRRDQPMKRNQVGGGGRPGIAVPGVKEAAARAKLTERADDGSSQRKARDAPLALNEKKKRKQSEAGSSTKRLLSERITAGVGGGGGSTKGDQLLARGAAPEAPQPLEKMRNEAFMKSPALSASRRGQVAPRTGELAASLGKAHQQAAAHQSRTPPVAAERRSQLAAPGSGQGRGEAAAGAGGGSAGAKGPVEPVVRANAAAAHSVRAAEISSSSTGTRGGLKNKATSPAGGEAPHEFKRWRLRPGWKWVKYGRYRRPMRSTRRYRLG
eukprot:jgi/Mesen1/3464/ME000194S02612